MQREPGRAFSYVLEAGLPLRDYRAAVTLTPGDGGTRIAWRSTFRPKVPGTGWIYRRALGTFIGRTVEGLAAAADPASAVGGRSPTPGRLSPTGPRPPPGPLPSGAPGAAPVAPAPSWAAACSATVRSAPSRRT